MRRWAKSVLVLGTILAFALGTAIADAPQQYQVVAAGPYTMTLNQSNVPASAPGIVTLTVRKDGKVATDLQPYGGASGYAEFVNGQTGATIRAAVNPAGTAVETTNGGTYGAGAAPAANLGGDIEISLPPGMPAATYTLKVHVRGSGDAVYTGTFTLIVK